MAGTGAARADASRPAAHQVPWYQRLWFRLLRRGLLFLFVLLLVDLVVLPELAGAHKAWNTLRSANWGYVVAAVVLEGAALVAYAGLTKAVLPPRSATLLTLLRIDLSTLAVSHVVPGGTAAGTPLAYRLLTEEGVSGTDAAFAVSTQGIGSAVVLNVILWVSLIITIPLRGLHTGSEAVYAVAASVGAVLFALFGGLLYFLTRGQRRAAAVLGAIGRSMPLLKEDQLVQAVDRLAKRLGELISDRRLLVRAVGWAAANWLADAACLWVFIAAFD
ncbi:MAG TPA: lysylphosphatidylglycerol synthase domain-containing protein, partial [Acidimicrobiales bacterium]|nr:lysylphosphatidylglycerol synthase domain-containing protein [Acidimicrobiales bacterium]